MSKLTAVFKECVEEAGSQTGLARVSQLRARGVGKRTLRNRLGAGEWSRVHRGLVHLGTDPLTFRQRVMAAVMSSTRGAVASHRSAGAIYGFFGIRAKEVEVSVPRRTLPPSPTVIVHHPKHLPEEDVGVYRGVPITTPARTLLDLAGLLDFHSLRRSILDAVEKQLVTLRQLNLQLERCGGQGRPGTVMMRAVLKELGDDDEPRETGLEQELHKVVAEGGYPPLEKEFVINDDGGDFVARLDGYWPVKRIFIEADGYQTHSSRFDFVHDRRRQNRLIALGYTGLRFTWEDARQPKPFLQDLARLWARRPGGPSPP